TEAIRRVDILPEEVALKYGYAPGQRVVNVVLRRRFRAMRGEIQGGAATEGGRLSGRAQINFLRVRGENRINFDLKYQDVTAVTEAQRDLAPLADPRAFDVVGHLVSL